MTVAGSHNATLVIMSIAIAVLASYTALDLAGRIRASSGWIRQVVRRQNIWRNSRRKLAECGPRLGVDVRRRACGEASADVRWSAV